MGLSPRSQILSHLYFETLEVLFGIHFKALSFLDQGLVLYMSTRLSLHPNLSEIRLYQLELANLSPFLWEQGLFHWGCAVKPLP